MGAKSGFLGAGAADEAPVRPIKGLSQDVVETIHGELFPTDLHERDVETERVEVQEEEVEMEAPEETVVVARKAPYEPTEEERLRHEATHLPYRAWCEYCVKGRGKCKPHQRRGEVEENGVPNISLDYFFLGGEDMEASENPMIVMSDKGRGNRYARMLDKKGLDEGAEWLLVDMAEEVRSWGYGAFA